MRHLDEKTVLRLALDEATDEERNLARGHLESCERCRGQVRDADRLWSRLEADPAGILPDTPLWPRVAHALEKGDRGTAVIRPVWKLALSEAWRSPVAYAALLVLVLGIGGGHLTGRALLGTAGAATTDEEILDYTALTGLPEGSLAASYLDDELYLTDETSTEEVQP